jgi:hypothetical protein
MRKPPRVTTALRSDDQLNLLNAPLSFPAVTSPFRRLCRPNLTLGTAETRRVFAVQAQLKHGAGGASSCDQAASAAPENPVSVATTTNLRFHILRPRQFLLHTRACGERMAPEPHDYSVRKKSPAVGTLACRSRGASARSNRQLRGNFTLPLRVSARRATNRSGLEAALMRLKGLRRQLVHRSEMLQIAPVTGKRALLAECAHALVGSGVKSALQLAGASSSARS